MEEGRVDTSSSEIDSLDELNLQEDDGWEDAEPDREEVKFICLFCQSEFPEISSMLQHCRLVHDFDLPNVQETFGV